MSQHCLVLDGVYRRTDGEPVFVGVLTPIDVQLQAPLHKIITRLMKMLTRRDASRCAHETTPERRRRPATAFSGCESPLQTAETAPNRSGF